MAHHDGHAIEVSDPGTLLGASGGIAQPFMLAGAIGLGASGLLAFISNDWQRFLFSYLHNFMFVLAIAIGALFFVLIQHITRSGWSVVVRRFAEMLTMLFVPLAVLFLFILFLLLGRNDQLYWWNNTEVAAKDVLVRDKMIYLNAFWFSIRAVVYFAFWILCSRLYLGLSAKQDQTGDPKISIRMERMAAVSLILFALSTTFAAVDWIMSLDPHWFSTIIGVYYFSNCAVSFFATLALIVFIANKNGILQHEITAEHRHDIGKLLFGFNCFWAYIAFSQYLLIWYSNIPEETVWYARRQENGWEVVAMILIVGHFVIPFLGLMSRTVKRNPQQLPMWAAYLLVMCWIDLYWLIMPEVSPGTPALSLLDLTSLLGIAGFAGFGAIKLAGGYSLLAKRDPRLPESLHFHNI